jgi:hypothetical protein
MVNKFTFYKNLDKEEKEIEELSERVKEIYAKSPSAFQKILDYTKNLFFWRPLNFTKNLGSKAKLYFFDLPFSICKRKPKKTE